MALPEIYPVFVNLGSPCLKDLQPYGTPGRNPTLPPIYQYMKQHPLRSRQSPEHRTFIYLVDSSVKGKENFEKICLAQKVPKGPIGGPSRSNLGLSYHLNWKLECLLFVLRACRSDRTYWGRLDFCTRSRFRWRPDVRYGAGICIWMVLMIYLDRIDASLKCHQLSRFKYDQSPIYPQWNPHSNNGRASPKRCSGNLVWEATSGGISQGRPALLWILKYGRKTSKLGRSSSVNEDCEQLPWWDATCSKRYSNCKMTKLYLSQIC